MIDNWVAIKRDSTGVFSQATIKYMKEMHNMKIIMLRSHKKVYLHYIYIKDHPNMTKKGIRLPKRKSKISSEININQT